MDALAETWFLSEKRSEDLYKGKTDEIIKALKAWVVARNARNKANLMLVKGAVREILSGKSRVDKCKH